MNSKCAPARVALVGCGAVSALYYAPALHELSASGELQLTMVFDPEREAAQRIAADFTGTRIADSFESLCDSPADLAIVASPPSLHARQSIELLRAGRSVLCEKPLATSLADAQAMVATATQQGRLLAAAMVRRFLPAAQVIRDVVARELLGELRHLRVAEGSAIFAWPASSPLYFRKSQSGGGVLMDIGVHVLDLIAWWFGEPAQLDYADDAMGGIEANALVNCRFASGMSGAIRLSRDTQLANSLLLRGSKGWLRWSGNLGEGIELGIDGSPYVLDATLLRNDSARAAADKLRAYTFEQSFVAQLRNVVAAVQGRTELQVPAAEALAGIRLVERCYERRSLIPMGWLAASEQTRAEELHRGLS